MGMLAEAFHPTPRESVTWGVADERWYRDLSTEVLEDGEGGLYLGPESILRCGTVLAAVRFRGDAWAMCPPTTFRKTARGREEDSGHYSQRVLRNPNAWMTGNRWRHLHGVWMPTWGNAYSELVSGPAAFVGELWPMHPSLVRIVDQRSDGSLVYEYRRPGASKPDLLGQERVLHFRDLSTDGMSGLPMYQLIRNVVMIALLAERHASAFLKKGARVSGLLVPSSPLDNEERKALAANVSAALGGVNNTGTFGVLPYGIDMKPISNTNRESQLTELNDQTVGAILRFLGVPGVVVNYADKTATYASAKEFFESGGIKHCVLPILANVEAEEEKALLLEGDDRQIKHNLDVLMRANTADRFDALFKAVGGPWMSVNEARRIEDMNPDPDPRHDRILTPSNMTFDPDAEDEPKPPPAQPPGRRPAQPAPEDDDDTTEPEERAVTDIAVGRALRLANLAAARVVRREVAAVADKAPKYARNPEGWRTWVSDYYARHVSHVQAALDVPKSVARAYCDRQRDELLEQGAAAAARWEDEATPRLAALAVEVA